MRNKEVLAWAFLAALTGCQAKPPQADTNQAQVKGSEVKEAEAEPIPEVKATPTGPGISKLEGVHRVAFDFLANRPLAHRLNATAQSVEVDATALDFVRYIHGNHPTDWNLEVDLDGVRAAALNKKRIGGLWVPSSIEGRGVIHTRVYSPAKGKLKFHVNGVETANQDVVQGWQTLSFETEALKAENALKIEFSGMGRISGVLSGGGLEWLTIGAQGVDAAGSKVPVEQGPLVLAAGQGAMFHLWGLKDAKLEFEASGSGCEVGFKWSGQSGTGIEALGISQVKLSDKLDSWVELPRYDDVLRVEVTSDCAEVTFSKLQLVAPGAATVRPQAERPKRIIFWLIDTLRADHLPIHFETNVRAPNLTRLAAEGASFKRAYVQGNESKTSHASLFSGMYPSKHGVVGRGKLLPEHEIMPEAIKAQGYRTMASVSNGYVSGPWGFEQGWDFYKNNIRQQLRIDGRSMAREGLAWLTEHADKDMFVYLGTIDPHVTYREHEDLIGNYETEPYTGKFKRACYGEDLGKIKSGSLKVTDRDKVRIQNLYKNEIEFNDRAFGELRQGLEEAGLWEGTMVVVTADHGDEFWEHGSVGHGHSLYQDQVHVPFIVYYPPMIPPTVVEAGVDVLDMYPTIMDVLGVERPKNLQGTSVLPLVFKETGDYPEPSVATQYKLHYAMQLMDWKLYLRRGEYQVYDRRTDSLELKDVSGDYPLASRWLLDSMGWKRAYRNTWDKQSWGTASNMSPEFLKLAGEVKRN